MLKQSAFLQSIEKTSLILAHEDRFEFVTPELIVYYGLMDLKQFKKTLKECGVNIKEFFKDLEKYIAPIERVPENIEYNPEISANLVHSLKFADEFAENTGNTECDVPHVIIGILNTNNCIASDLLRKHMKCSEFEFIMAVLVNFGFDITNLKLAAEKLDYEFEHHEDKQGAGNLDNEEMHEPSLESFAKVLNTETKNMNPLVGRENEMERTIQVFCKKNRHNVLYIGEPGVGKTAMVEGFTQIIVDDPNTLPHGLGSAKVYQVELTSLLAGSQFRGDFEKRVKGMMDEICSKNETSIVYIDDIHNLVGLGANGDSENDAASMMLPYMDRENVRFIGTTNFKDFKKSFENNKALLRRFQIIEINEPSVDETVRIIEALKPIYEKYHKVKFKKDTIKYAVDMSVKYINDRCLPEKAIDLLDEAGAYREMHPLLNDMSVVKKIQSVDCKLIADMLTKVKKITNIPDHDDQNETMMLSNLSYNIKNQIYGQDQAVNQVVESVLMSKAGLLDENKPIASLLFVGQTGVGKTEIAKVLAQELNLELIRFDMSEYTEKHTVAKLIGSPAGYVGYDDGGLLTDAIRKNPNCVLLLDEIEKAHPDIYNIMLQIMDYASLTDNKGQKADFKHVVLIMTSNIGAQYANQSTMGFTGGSTGDAMMSAAKKYFKPEFLNRLSATVIFNDMDENMAALILDKKLNEIRNRLKSKNITLNLTEGAKKELLKKGFSPKYGAREIDRVLNSMLNPLLMHEILFGKLKEGGNVNIDFNGEKLELTK